MPGSLSIITQHLQRAELGRALGLWAGISGLALGMGPVVGGLLVEKAGWEWIFFLNVPVALIAAPLTVYAVRESRDETAIRRVDLLGIATLSLGLGGLVIGLVQANDYGWTSGRHRGRVRGRRGRHGRVRPAPAARPRPDAGHGVLPQPDVQRRAT